LLGRKDLSLAHTHTHYISPHPWKEYLNDPDSYAGWTFYTPVRATQTRQVEG